MIYATWLKECITYDYRGHFYNIEMLKLSEKIEKEIINGMIRDVFSTVAVLKQSLRNEEFIRQTIQRIVLKVVGQAGAKAWK